MCKSYLKEDNYSLSLPVNTNQHRKDVMDQNSRNSKVLVFLQKDQELDSIFCFFRELGCLHA